VWVHPGHPISEDKTRLPENGCFLCRAIRAIVWGILACAEQIWWDRMDSCRKRAAFYRKVIEQAERPGGRGSYPRWAETRAILLEMAESFERDAREAEGQAPTAGLRPEERAEL
jgi:hypothetical protein